MERRSSTPTNVNSQTESDSPKTPHQPPLPPTQAHGDHSSWTLSQRSDSSSTPSSDSSSASPSDPSSASPPQSSSTSLPSTPTSSLSSNSSPLSPSTPSSSPTSISSVASATTVSSAVLGVSPSSGSQSGTSALSPSAATSSLLDQSSTPKGSGGNTLTSAIESTPSAASAAIQGFSAGTSIYVESSSSWFIEEVTTFTSAGVATLLTSLIPTPSPISASLLPITSPLQYTSNPSGSIQGIENDPTATSSATSAKETSVPELAHNRPEAVILGTSIGGGGLLVLAVTILVVCIIRRRTLRRGRRGRAASRNDSFFAAERPLVSPFPTLSRPQSHATATSIANTLSDEERWTEYRNAHGSPPLLPNTGLVSSRETLLVDHIMDPLSPPAPMQDVGYAVLSRASPHSATFPHEQHAAPPSARGIALIPNDMSPYEQSAFSTPPSSSSPASASFSQYIVYDGIDVGSITETAATPRGQRVPVAATSSYGDDYFPSPSMLPVSPRRSFASLQSERSAGAVGPDETHFGMAI